MDCWPRILIYVPIEFEQSIVCIDGLHLILKYGISFSVVVFLLIQLLFAIDVIEFYGIIDHKSDKKQRISIKNFHR